MKDIELLLPMLREFLDERGLNEVKIELKLLEVPIDIISNTYQKKRINHLDFDLAKQVFKSVNNESDTITLESKYF